MNREKNNVNAQDTLIDLAISDELAEETKGGTGHQGEIEIQSWSIGTYNPTNASTAQTTVGTGASLHLKPANG
ncbi:MAG TPA: hypothetical protein VG778_09680 [Blastocatellia bacterium]|nr:hypothetical protein [Blastocatellia bacterium]